MLSENFTHVFTKDFYPANQTPRNHGKPLAVAMLSEQLKALGGFSYISFSWRWDDSRDKSPQQILLPPFRRCPTSLVVPRTNRKRMTTIPLLISRGALFDLTP